MISSMTGAAWSMPIVEKHGLWSIGVNRPPSRVASVNSFSNAAFSATPARAARSIILLRKLRGHASHGVPSSVCMSHRSRADFGA